MRLVLMLLALAVSEEAEFYRGANLERDGKFAEAAEVFRALVARAPTDAFADDALLELGQLEEEKLGDPVAALAAYERLVVDFPDSRLAVRAGRRAETLRALLGPANASAEATRAWGAIFYGFAGRPRAETIAQVAALLAAHPDFPGAARATFWLATLLRDEGRPAEALTRAHEVGARFPDAPEAVRARRLEGDLLLAAGDLDAAEAVYDPADRARVDLERWRGRGLVVAWLVLAAAALGAVVAARGLRPLARPPVEFFYLLPVAALFVGAGLTENGALGHAVETIVAGGLAATWLSGAALEAARARGPVRLRRALAHAAVAGLAVLAVCYISVTRERLVDQLIETIRYGAD